MRQQSLNRLAVKGSPGFTLTEFHDAPAYAGLGVRSRVPRMLWMRADQVAAASLRSLEQGQWLCVPGGLNRLMIWAASLPRPFRITRRGSLRALLALRARPMAPSAAANDSCPARNAKHFVSSRSSMLARLPCPMPTLRSSATDPGMQKACRPSPRRVMAWVTQTG